MATGRVSSAVHSRSRSGACRTACSVLAVAALSLPVVAVRAADDKQDKEKGVRRASLVLKVNPSIAFSPARIVISAELRGGSAEDPELYCPNVEWDWGDGTRSEATENCEPFEAGKSEIKRRWTVSHTFETQGNYRVQLRLKRGERTVLAGNSTVQVKPGVRDVGAPFDQP